MSYSFIKPKLKPLLSPFSKLWITFILATLGLMVMLNISIVTKTAMMKYDIKSLKMQAQQTNKKINKTNYHLTVIAKEKGVAEEIFASNEILKDSMKNLFDLVPDQITLSKVYMQKNSLIIYGSTPTKEAYNFLLGSPLRSIFNTSQVSFYLTQSGWYNFVSTNKFNNTDGIYE